MAENTKTVEQFLRNLLMRTIEKEEQELVRIVGSDVLQDPVKGWNLGYLKEQYNKKNMHSMRINSVSISRWKRRLKV